MSEFELIGTHFASGWYAGEEVALGVGDDGALIDPAAVTASTLGMPGLGHIGISDSIFSAAAVNNIAEPGRISGSSMARLAFTGAVYRLAARGAVARWLTLGLTLPDYDQTWVTEFSLELKAVCLRHRVSLAGGDTTRGPLCVSTVCQGPGLTVDRQPARKTAQTVMRASLPSPCAVAYLSIRGGQVSLSGEAAWVSAASGPGATVPNQKDPRATAGRLFSSLVHTLVDEETRAQLERHWPGQFEVIGHAPNPTPAT